MDALTRHPSSTLEIGNLLRRSFVFSFHGRFLRGSALQFSNQSLNDDAASGPEKIDRLRFGETFAQARYLGASVGQLLCGAVRVEGACERANLTGYGLVVGIAGGIKQCSHLRIGQAVD